MTVAELAAQDQAEAREREFDRRALPWVWAFLVAMLGLAGYSLLGLSGDVPLPSWAPAASRGGDTFSPFALSIGLGLVAIWFGLGAIFRAYDLTRARLRR